MTLIFLITSCKNSTTESKKVIGEIFDCKKGEMKPAWYEHGIDEPIPNIQGLQNGFLIVVDTNNKATNFISFDEVNSRSQSLELDTNNLNWTEGWDTLNSKQKWNKVYHERKLALIQADSTHLLNNQGQQQIWIINNTKDTITIQMQDWSYICILQAKTKSGKWYPMQFWRFSTCGNSYYFKQFLPKSANSFITKIPDNGNYKTKLRYKLLGKDKYYYSNEFDGRINYCEFAEDSTDFDDSFEKRQPHFKLDSVINLARNW